MAYIKVRFLMSLFYVYYHFCISNKRFAVQFLPMADKKTLKTEKEISNISGEFVLLSELLETEDVGEVCCGGLPPPKSNPFERAGYELKHFVCGFVRTEKDDIPIVQTKLGGKDNVGTLLTRLGFGRDDYKVSPGLYGVGLPDADSPVIVTANYKLTFDSVRKELESVDCWMLVLDTRGVNVWCAAGKNTFSTEEIVRRVESTMLAKRVNHRRLIVPQLGATGVAAHVVKSQCGFRVIYGPVKASDINGFLNNDMEATVEMRAVTFTLAERFVLVPVEFYLFSKKIWWVFPIIFILSGIGPSIFSLNQCWQRGLLGSAGIILAGILGAMVVPLLLPWIPGRSFSFKGGLIGFIGGIAMVVGISGIAVADQVGIVCAAAAVSSYLAMNFTGSTPYTSPSGVEKEMKIAIPIQAITLFLGTAAWFVSPFL
jgi:hypothetical protein